MRQAWVLGVGVGVVFAVAACSGGASSGDGAFDSKWASLNTSGGAIIVQPEGQGRALLGEVREATAAPAAEVAPSDTPIEGPLSDAEVSKVVRSRARSIGACFQQAARDGASGGGKAIVSLNIAAEGKVSEVGVEAPSFDGTGLAECVQTRARGWTFPKCTEGPKSATFPFVFAGQ